MCRLVRQALDMGGRLDIDAVTADMRMRRNYMVQTEVQYMFIYRAVLDCCAELLSGEFKKVEHQQMKEAEEAEMAATAEAASAAKAKEEAEEKKEIAAAQRELASMAEASAENAKAVIGMSLKDRINLLNDAERRWIENYKKSLEEWSERNQVHGRAIHGYLPSPSPYVCVCVCLGAYMCVRVCACIGAVGLAALPCSFGQLGEV